MQHLLAGTVGVENIMHRKRDFEASSRVSADGLVPQADAKRAQDAVKWIQRAFTLIEKMEDADTAGVVDLKVRAL